MEKKDSLTEAIASVSKPECVITHQRIEIINVGDFGDNGVDLSFYRSIGPDGITDWEVDADESYLADLVDRTINACKELQDKTGIPFLKIIGHEPAGV